MAGLVRGPEHAARLTELGVDTPGLRPRPRLQVLVGLAGAAAELGVAPVRVRPEEREVLRTPALGLISLRVVAKLLGLVNMSRY